MFETKIKNIFVVLIEDNEEYLENRKLAVSEYNKDTIYEAELTLINAGGGAIIIHHRRIAFFSATKHRMNLGPVCKFEFCRCGPVEKNQSALSVSV